MATANLSESYVARSVSPPASVSASSGQPLPTPTYHGGPPFTFLANSTNINNNNINSASISPAASVSGRLSNLVCMGHANPNASSSNIFTAQSFAYSQTQTPVNTSMAFSNGPSAQTQSPPSYSNFYTNNNNNTNMNGNVTYAGSQQLDGLSGYQNPSSAFIPPSAGTSALTPPSLAAVASMSTSLMKQQQSQTPPPQSSKLPPPQKQQGGVQDVPAALLLDTEDPVLSHTGPLGAATAASLMDLALGMGEDVSHAAPLLKFAAMMRQKWHPNYAYAKQPWSGAAGIPSSNARPYDLFSVYYMQSLAEENRKREIELQLRNSATKVSSTFSFVRLEGLRELLQLMSELLTIATIESQEKRQELLLQEQLAEEEAAAAADHHGPSQHHHPHAPNNTNHMHGNDFHSTEGLPSRGIASALPYDAVRAEITGRGEDYPLYSPTWVRTQEAAQGMDYTSSVFHLILVPRAEVRAKIVMGTPVDVVLTEEEALAWCPTHTAAVSPANLPYIPLAQQQQREAAAKNADGPADGSARSSNDDQGGEHAGAGEVGASKDGAAASVSASPLDGNKAASTNSLSIGLNRGAAAAAAGQSPARKKRKDGGGGAGGGGGKGGNELPPPPPRSIYEIFTVVTTEEQELAFRVLQGLCLCYNHQRRCIGESALVQYATEILQCYLQHRAAWYRKRRREQTGRMLEELRPRLAALWSSPTTSANNRRPSATSAVVAENEREKEKGDRSGRRARAAEKESVDGAAHGVEEDVLAAAASAADELADVTDDEVELLLRSLRAHCASLEESEQQLRQLLDQLPVTQPEDPSVERMLVALIDCLEAACHYNPVCLTRWVQTGGVRALLDLIYPPYIPTRLRVAVLETISILLQEVAPFRRMVQPAAAAASPAADLGEGGRAPHPAPEPHHPGEADGLLPLMLRQANSGNYGTAAGPPPYWMDRASASKFENAAKEWFSRKGLSHVVTNIMQLRKTKRVGEAEVAVEGRDRQRMRQLAEMRVSELLQAIDRVAASAEA